MIFKKIDRFTGEYYRWEDLNSKSNNCSPYYFNSKEMLKEEKETFMDMIERNIQQTLSCGGQFLYLIET